MKQIITLVFLKVLIIFTLHSQCEDDYILTTQGQVDSFLIYNPECSSEVKGTIGIAGDDISNISGLLGITRIQGIGITQNNIKSLHGLDSVTFINNLTIYHDDFKKELENATALQNVDSIEVLLFHFNDHIQDFKFLESISYINKLVVFNNGYLEGLNNCIQSYKSKLPEVYIFQNDFDNSFMETFHPSVDSIEQLYVSGENFSFEGTENIKHIEYLSLVALENFSLKGLQNLKSILYLWIKLVDFKILDRDYLFNELERVNIIEFFENEGLDSISKIIDRPIEITNYINFSDNADLQSLSPLLDADAPMGEALALGSADNKIEIANNPDLDLCSGKLICRALELYPDSVLIENNKDLCNLEYLLENCDAILPSDEIERIDIVVYPNPSSSYVTIASDQIIDYIGWYNLDGREVDVTKSQNGTYDITGLASGIYYLRMDFGDEFAIRRLVKL